MLTIDYQEINKKLIDIGTYEAVIYNAYVTRFHSQNRGIVVSLAIRDDIEQPFGGFTVRDNLVLTENALYRFQLVANAVGLPNGKNLSLYEFCEEILGKPVQIKIRHQEWDGLLRERVSTYGPGEPLTGFRMSRSKSGPSGLDGGTEPIVELVSAEAE